jgi:hypothetical protein
VIAHQDQKLADYIDDLLPDTVPSCGQMRIILLTIRTKFDFVVACGLAELDEDGMGRPASGSGSASKELTMFGIYTKTPSGRKDGARYL